MEYVEIANSLKLSSWLLTDRLHSLDLISVMYTSSVPLRAVREPRSALGLPSRAVDPKPPCSQETLERTPAKAQPLTPSLPFECLFHRSSSTTIRPSAPLHVYHDNPATQTSRKALIQQQTRAQGRPVSMYLV
jgi:hypothetical protein